ncbi:MAG TPA: alpha/beta hydrolase family protein [Chitinophagaceae bacterium]|nr:alpha/beta hydrolase family protein [Chitinophagaceae bacterium]
MKKTCLLIVGLFYAAFIYANVDTVYIFSKAMQKDIKTVVIKPSNYKKKKNSSYPVVYLLHGAMGVSTNWIRKVPQLQEMADEHQLIIVCPDGSVNSWYFDSPVDSSYRYETHVGTEVPEYIDANYNTIANRNFRAISGLSMGGHGAMFIALRHPQTFSACGSMSGALAVNLITRGYDMQKRLGDTITNRKYYEDWSVLKVMESYQPKDSISIIVDCGLNDFIYGMSKAAHEKLIQLKIPHDYIERSGKHDWFYWANAVRYQLLFFKEHFKRKKRYLSAS